MIMMHEAPMISTHLLLFCICIAVVRAHAPCVDFSAVCVPAFAMERGCRCVLISAGKEASARLMLADGRQRDVIEDVRFEILSQNAVDELNRFFPASARKSVDLNTTVFASIQTKIRTSLFTLPTSMIAEVLNTQDDWMSPASVHHLHHCGEPRCEVDGQVTDLLGDPSPTRQDRSFRVARALRYDIAGNDTTLLAFASATSQFVLNKELVQWQEQKCKRPWFFLGLVKKCRTVMKRSEKLRVFDEVSKKNWMDHIQAEMVDKFRRNYANLLLWSI